jgi:hypothetical protein
MRTLGRAGTLGRTALWYLTWLFGYREYEFGRFTLRIPRWWTSSAKEQVREFFAKQAEEDPTWLTTPAGVRIDAKEWPTG